MNTQQIFNSVVCAIYSVYITLILVLRKNRLTFALIAIGVASLMMFMLHVHTLHLFANGTDLYRCNVPTGTDPYGGAPNGMYS